MMMRLKALIIAAAFCAALTSCATASSRGAAPGGDGGLSAVLLVGADAGETVRQAAFFFADELAGLTGGSITVRTEASGNVPEDFRLAADDGSFVLAFIDNGGCTRMNALFSLFAEPFLFDDYTHFTMSVNASATLDALKTGMKAKAAPLAGFYTGAGFAVSRIRIDEPALFEGLYAGSEPVLIPESIPVVMMTGENSARADVYEGLGAFAVPAALEDRLEAFETEIPVIAEFFYTEASYISFGPDSGEVYLTQTFHDPEPLWLMAGEAFLEALTVREKAYLAEAVAALFDKIDGERLRSEESALRLAYSRFVNEGEDFSRTRKEIRSLIEAGRKRGAAEKKLREYIGAIGR